MSPLNESELSEVENSPTPRSYGSQDGDLKTSHINREHEENNEEQNNEKIASKHGKYLTQDRSYNYCRIKPR